ncbi:N-acetyl-gamma-glutamyl-phosphate reductase [Roseivivax halodurans JCM 10272]|uniref:N-acetyl-gamma-glutamyl-phosphate reductase n=1 Tax=Roseivivax halodurans JCM 10272 TaxID=1449350 RepID=X7EGB4_9RHOB|nr:YrhK family protein [Roseivivax halodurans]ETX14158.1 N-acetyl-gamma-glutamyl-phosphate reductase [Roseivivax halodurans JCM 10272]
MKLFRHETRQQSAETRRLYARYEVAHTIVDFLAAFLFLVGSVLFFWKALETAAIWCFVIGSVFFCVKPTLRLAREIHLWRIGRTDTLARAEEQTIG